MPHDTARGVAPVSSETEIQKRALALSSHYGGRVQVIRLLLEQAYDLTVELEQHLTSAPSTLADREISIVRPMGILSDIFEHAARVEADREAI